MKKFLILSLLFVSGWSVASINQSTVGDGIVHTIVNSTSHPIYIDTVWFKGGSTVFVRERVDASECVYLRNRYCDRQDHDSIYPAHNCIDWVFENMIINVQNESFRQPWLEDLQVVENDFFWVIENIFPFKLTEVQEQDESASCKIFVPDQSVFIGGNGNTALHDATRANDLEEAGRLIQQGASINIRNKDGFTALDLARSGEYFGIMNLLKQYGGRASVELIRPATLSFVEE